MDLNRLWACKSSNGERGLNKLKFTKSSVKDFFQKIAIIFCGFVEKVVMLFADEQEFDQWLSDVWCLPGYIERIPIKSLKNCTNQLILIIIIIAKRRIVIAGK
jgi:hypothetical protein